jgi:hypothetical protein
MSFKACIDAAVEAKKVSRIRGDRANAIFDDLMETYLAQGHADDIAAVLAGFDTQAAMKKAAGDARHTFLATTETLRKMQADVKASPDLATLATSKVEFMENRPNKGGSIVAEANGLRRQFHHRLEQLILKHHRNLLGNSKDKAGLLNVARELHGQNSGDTAAKAVANGVRDAFKEMRRMFNEAGGTIGELADWGLPHTHDQLAITKAGFETWYDYIKDRVAWDRMEDRLTGKPMAEAGAQPPEAFMRRVLGEIFDNIAFGRKSGEEPVYGRTAGQNLVKQLDAERVIHFRDADAWIEYNKRFGSGDVYGSIISHAHRMAEDITAMKRLTPSPELGLDYLGQLLVKEARERGDPALADAIKGNVAHAQRMLRIQRGGTMPNNLRTAMVARFFSSVRHGLSAALLDRAMIASLSDLNSMRMAAKAMGMNPANVVARHMKLLTDGASEAQMARMGWIADTMADPGLVLARWQAEVPPAALAERLSSGVMRAQGLAHWTDMAKVAFQSEMAGVLADSVGKPLADLPEPFQRLLREKGLTDAEWDAFANPAHMFTTETGATFLSPIWWRQSTDLDPAQADAIFAKVQTMFEEQTEFAVPTQNLWARAGIEADDVPGTIGYELKKSALMVKSFAMTFTVNQISRTLAQKGPQARAIYAFDLLAGSTIMGAVSLQIGELLYGRDMQDMTDPSFWGRAVLKGGGFGVIGDLVAAGESSWGGGFGSYISGPMPQLVGDVWNLSVRNAVDLMSGKDTHFGRDLVKFLDRYTPGADLPGVGLAIDRLVWDSLQTLVDPEAEQALYDQATRRQNLYGNKSWWMPGSPMPGRLPNPLAAVGG